MKKVLIILAAVVITALAVSSCKSSQDCPAYGETHRYQIEQKY